jgi:putative peptidoglycan lipid II flippase
LSGFRRLDLQRAVSPEPLEDDQARDGREARSAALVALAILASKVVGLVRQRVTAHFFGTSDTADVVAAAFRAGNLAQNLLGEGALSASFIPVLARLRAQGDEAGARRLAHAALGALAVVVAGVSLVGVLGAPWLARLVAGGFDGPKLARTAELVRIVFPMTGLLVLSAWALGVLNAHRRFFVPYAAPIVWSLAQIAALWAGGTWLALSDQPLARVLAWGAFAGAVLELALLCARAAPLVGGLRLRFETRHPPLREAAQKLPAVLLARGVMQLSGLIDTLLVSFLATGANATFAYAQTLYLLPLSLLGTGEAAVSLPEMARDTAQGDVADRNARMRARLGATLGRVLTMAVPAAVALGVCGGDLVRVLLRTGSFDEASTRAVAAPLAVYGVALCANAAARLFATTFFALGDTRRPARYATVRVVVSALLALALVRPLGVVGVVAAAAVAGWVEAVLLGARLRAEIGGLGLAATRPGRLAALAAASAVAPLAARAVLPAAWQASALGSLVVLGALGAAFLVGAPALGLFAPRAWLRRAR